MFIDYIGAMDKPKYLKKNVAAITGLSERQVQFYANKELVKGYQAQRGRGHHIKYNKNDLIKFMFIRELNKFNIPIHRIENLLAYVFSKTINEPDVKEYLAEKEFLQGDYFFIQYQVRENVETTDKINATFSTTGYIIMKKKAGGPTCIFDSEDMEDGCHNALLIDLGSLYRKLHQLPE